MGVEVERTRRVAFVAASLLVGAAVSVSGMIGRRPDRAAPPRCYRARPPTAAVGPVPRRRGLSSGPMPRTHVARSRRRPRRRGDAHRRALLPLPAPRDLAGCSHDAAPGPTRSFRVRRSPILRDVTASVAPGEVLGDRYNGSGKTTLCVCCRGPSPTAGEVRWRPVVWRIRRRELAQRLAVVPQIPCSNFPSPRSVVLMGRARITAPPRARDLAIAREAMAVLESPTSKTARSSTRAASAGVLLAGRAGAAGDVLDEPTTHLDLRHQTGIHEAVRALGRAPHGVAGAARSQPGRALLRLVPSRRRSVGLGAARRCSSPRRASSVSHGRLDRSEPSREPVRTAPVPRAFLSEPLYPSATCIAPERRVHAPARFAGLASCLLP